MTLAARIPQGTHITLNELEKTIRKALKKMNVQNELGLCPYLTYEDKQLSPSQYLRLKDAGRETLHNLIQENILDTYGNEQYPENQQSYTGPSLESCIKKAMAKLNISNETGLCKYIPIEDGHIHHFTYLKLKSSNPVRIRNLIQENILNKTPSRILPKSRKRKFASKSLRNTEEQYDQCLKDLIKEALSREDLSMQNERDICNFLPWKGESMGLQTYRYLKNDNPKKLAELIQEYLIEPKSIRKIDLKDTEPQNSEIGWGPRSDNRSPLSLKTTEGKLDQLLTMVGQLVQCLQETSIAKKTSTNREQPRTESSDMQTAIEKYIQFIQNELTIKILRREVNHILCDDFIKILLLPTLIKGIT
ncbi:MAG: hypothetical protein KDK71_08245 [Chlamydiia bacterium]|nr:hypothetical protein [Chlamydiia bacterium]